MSGKIQQLFYGFADAPRRKGASVSIRFSKKERDELCEYSAKFGQSPSQYAREAIALKIEIQKLEEKYPGILEEMLNVAIPEKIRRARGTIVP